MARMSIDIPTTIKKIERTLTRTSTGNSSIKIKEPNYLRVSTGSCHDICKYDTKRAFAVKPWRPVGRILDKNHRGTKAFLTSPKVMSKPKTCKSDTFSQQVAPKQPIRSSSDKRESQNDAGKEAKTPKKSNSPKLIPSAKSRTGKKDSQAEIKNKTYNVVEKIIHVIEPEDECRNNNRKKAIERVIIPEENYSKMKLNRGNHKKNDVSIGGVVRHDQCVGWKNGDSVLLNIVIEERASNLQVKMRKTKVEALVGAFQSVISNTPQDYI